MKKIKLFALTAIALGMLFTSCEEAPTADFSTPSGTLYATKSIQFTNLSEGGNIDSDWTFESADNTTSTQESPSAIWSEPGIYDVTLVATNSSGSDEITKSVTIEEYIPFIKVKNNTPGALYVCIGTDGPSSSTTDYSWAQYYSDATETIVSGETVDVKLPSNWDTNADKVYVWISNSYLNKYWSIDADENNKIVWTGSGSSYLDLVDFDSEYTIDCGEDFFHVTMDNQGYSSLTGVYAYMGDAYDQNQVGYANITTAVDAVEEIGYFDAYTGVNIGSFFNSSQYIEWSEGSSFSFASGMENFAVTLLNSSYKSTGASQAITTSGSTGIPLVGSKELKTPRKVNIGEETK